MLRSRNVALQRTTDAPLRCIETRYGSDDNAEALLEKTVLAAERRAKGRDDPLQAGDAATAHLWVQLTQLLDDLSAYGALGSLGGADPRFCQRLQPLLTRLTKCIVMGGFEVEDGAVAAAAAGEGDDSAWDVEALLQAASKALANCSDGVACRCADTALEIDLTATEPGTGGGAAPASVLRACFGFADYSSSETGAMLWAGAVGLSLYLVENFTSCIADVADRVQAAEHRPLRVIELGCGPALVSLALASLTARRCAPVHAEDEGVHVGVRCVLDVTDVSATVVAEAQRSFERRNGPLLAAMVSDGDAAVQVRPFCLDFTSIPDTLRGQYDLVVASDVVYDHAIAAHVAPALELLLRPGGTALLCCEAHRDGMADFTGRIRRGHPGAPHLRVREEVRDVQTVLSELRMLPSLTASTCSLIRIDKVVQP